MQPEQDLTTFCRTDTPICWNDKMSDGRIKAIKIHNARYLSVCKPKACE